ncbi:hypothetical protein GCM10023238_06810 [Streptomyces heliomycini]
MGARPLVRRAEAGAGRGSFKGAGTLPFTGDRSTLTLVDPMHVDMANIAFDRNVYERLPLPPATATSAATTSSSTPCTTPPCPASCTTGNREPLHRGAPHPRRFPRVPDAS